MQWRRQRADGKGEFRVFNRGWCPVSVEIGVFASVGRCQAVCFVVLDGGSSEKIKLFNFWWCGEAGFGWEKDIFGCGFVLLGGLGGGIRALSHAKPILPTPHKLTVLLNTRHTFKSLFLVVIF